MHENEVAISSGMISLSSAFVTTTFQSFVSGVHELFLESISSTEGYFLGNDIVVYLGPGHELIDFMFKK